MSDFDWNDERIGLLEKLWADGLSASQIAAELGDGVTRNAIIGKVHRLGLNGHGGMTKGTATPRPTRVKQPRRSQSGGHILLEADVVELPPESIVDLEIPLEQRRTLLQLTEKTCRWPVGTPGTGNLFFCGGPADNSVEPYCAFHSRVAYAGAPKGIPRTNSYRTFR